MGALGARAKDIPTEMQIAAMVSDNELGPDYIMPEAFKPGVVEAVANSVRQAVK